jgi:hypothetical protein
MGSGADKKQVERLAKEMVEESCGCVFADLDCCKQHKECEKAANNLKKRL